MLRPMTAPEFQAWMAAVIPDYADDKVASGHWAREEALALSTREFGELLPQGLATDGHHLYTVLDPQGAPVGSLWFEVQTRFEARIAFVFDVVIEPAHRRQGHARRAFLALEHEVRRLGLSGIALHVFGHNTAGRALYAGLGFEPTNISLFKPVGASADAA